MQPDVITQEELEKASEYQITVWRIERECREYIKSLAHRIDQGAQIQHGALVWDGENEMVRSRKAASE